jgi:hypothetical protein
LFLNPVNKTTQTTYFTTEYAFFCVFYCCFTTLLFSQNTTNSVYIATHTSVFGIENSYIKKIEKKQITLYLKENTGYYGLNTLKNTRLLFFNRNTKSYKINTVAKTSQFRTNTNSSHTNRCFKQTDKNPYSNRWLHGKLVVISLVTGQQKNTNRKKQFRVSKFKAVASALETRLKIKKNQTYPTTTLVRSSICWFVNTYAKPPPQRT